MSMFSGLTQTHLVLIGIFLVGWLLPLVIGIIELRRRHHVIGIVLTVVGALWAMPAIAGLLTVGLMTAGRRLAPTDASVFDAGRARGPVATVVVPWKGRGELEYRSADHRWVSKSTDGRYAVPAGALVLSTFTAYSGPETPSWQAQTQLYQMGPLTTSAGQEQPLQVGPPYVASPRSRAVSSMAPRGHPVFELQVTDVGGHKTSISDPARKSPPSLQLVDKSGKVVWQSKFAYG